MSKISSSGKATLCFLAIAFLMVLGSISVGVGQNPPQPMYSSQIVMDGHCDLDGTICGLPGAGCASVSVMVDSRGNYKLHAWVDCAPQNQTCGGCYACAYLIRPSDGQVMLGGIQTLCNSPCDGTSGYTQLLPGIEYKLYVCKKPCDNHDCATCDVECVAKAQITG